jgi:4-amino-4-deoxy-L-arabinose transferase-like glycosyltransferase
MGRKEIICLVVILLIAAFLRLWRIPEYMTFLGDEGRDVLVVRDMLLGRKYTLIGPGTSIGNMYLGPWYYYMLLVPLWIANFSPLGPAVFVCILGLLTVALLWWVGRIWIGRWESLAISFLYAISPVVITYSRSSWNPNIMPFFALLTIYSLWVVWRYHRLRWLLVASVSFAMVLNSHYLGLLLLPTICIFMFLSRKTPGFSKYVVSFILLLLLLLSPLVIFDFRHGGANFAAMKKFFSERQTTVNAKPYKALPYLWPIWQDINSSLLTANNNQIAVPVAILSLVSISISVFYRRRPQFWLILSWLGFGVMGLGLYKQHIYDHYFGFVFPAVFLCLGLVFRLIGKIPSILLLILLTLINIHKNPFTSEPNRQLVRTGQVADFIHVQSTGRPYNLALIARSNYDASYRYLLDLKGSPYRTIHDQLTDQLFVICESPDPARDCQPINHPLWEIAAFGWAKIDQTWDFPWQVKVYKLVHNPSGIR